MSHGRWDIIDWLCEAYYAEVEAGRCCETLALRATERLPLEHPDRPGTVALGAITTTVTAEQVATTVTAWSHLHDTEPAYLIRSALSAFTGLDQSEREVF